MKHDKPNYFGHPLIERNLHREQWIFIERLNTKLEEEFKTRRQLLLTRLEVTLQAFTWKKEKAEDVEQVINREVKTGLRPNCSIPLTHLLAARTDLAHQSKTSNTSVLKNTHTSIHKYKMGKVPDRGGRAWETRPPPEMPSFQPRVEHTDNREGRQGQQRDYQRNPNWGRSYDNQNQFQATRQFSHEPSRQYNDKPMYQSSMSYDTPRTDVYQRELGSDYYEARESRGNQRRPRGGEGGGYHRRGRGSFDGQGGMISRDYH
ncbi:Protein FAM98A-like [Oopsacas minuta]|uniref:Protein FAM98A-like n=1 Tax=Oopsacas minuta TaxID=111878 RepID=A0AAV7K6Z6_9METZ|nr:Protein FAM98A-like [Oopsacas minuta]